MKSIGVVRKIDPVGRLTLPVELRKQFHLRKGDELELFVDGDIVNHMMDYSANELESIVSVMTDAQKESIANLFADKLYHGEELDLNKIAIISKHLPVGIEQMVQEKKDFDERAKAAKKDN